MIPSVVNTTVATLVMHLSGVGTGSMAPPMFTEEGLAPPQTLESCIIFIMPCIKHYVVI